MDDLDHERQRSPAEQRADHLLPEHASSGNVATGVAESHGRQRTGRLVSIAIFTCTALILLLTLYVATVNPGTHDASVGADYIGLSPQVSGQVTALHVGESSCVPQGALLVEIDGHDYKTKLMSAESDQQDLEAQIRDKQRQINSSQNQAASSFDKYKTSKIDYAKAGDQVGSSAADVKKARASVDQAQVTYNLAQLQVERYRPLAERAYISRQKFDQYVTERDSDADSLREAEDSLRSKQYMHDSDKKTRREDAVDIDSSFRSYSRDSWSVPTLDQLLAQRESKASEVEQARTNLLRTRITSPVNGCVTALSISRGAYAKEGSALFTLIDNDSWYITAAYRESDLRYIRPGMKAVVYLMSDPNHAVDGTVQSIGNAVESSDSSSIGGSPGSPGSLPVIERSMNWVRLASRYPVRIRFTPRDPSTLRIGTTANVTILH